MESARSEGQLPSIQSHSPPLGADSSLGLHVSSTQKHGHDASCPDHWYFYTVSLFRQFFPNQSLDAQILHLSLSNGGFSWIPNLTDVDHSLILPVFMALTNLAIIQIQVMSKVGASSWLSNAMMNVLRVVCLVMVPVAACAPAVRLVLVWIIPLIIYQVLFYNTGRCALLDGIVGLRTGPEFSPTLAKLQEIFPDTRDTQWEASALSAHHQPNKSS